MSAAQGWDRNRRRGGGAAGSGGGGGGSGAGGGSGGSGGRGTGQLNRFVQLSGRPHLPGESWGRVLTGCGRGGRAAAPFPFLPSFFFPLGGGKAGSTRSRGTGASRRGRVSLRPGREQKHSEKKYFLLCWKLWAESCVFFFFFQRRGRCFIDIPKCFAYSVPSLVLFRSLIF